MTDLIIVGASGFGRELLQMVKELNAIKKEWNILGFIDDNVKALDGIECDYSVIGKIHDWKPTNNERYAIAIAAPKIKKEIVELLESRGAEFATLIHPSAKISDHVKIGKGLIMKAFTTISVNVEIGDFVFFNLMAGVGHDSIIGNYCMLGPRCSMSGHTTLGEGVTIGAHAATYPGVSIGEYATLGMNSVAIRRVKPNTTVFGVPAKTI